MLSQIRIYTINKGEIDAFSNTSKRKSWQCTSESVYLLLARG